MSMVLTMTACAVIAGLSLSEVSLAALVASSNDEELDQGLETIFTDMEILEKTLLEMDCHMKKISENELQVETTCGVLRYVRGGEGQAFRLFLDEITEVEGLVENIRSFERDYGRNVQEYTYQHIKSSLGGNMSIENECYEGDELYLTISIDE